MRASRAYRWSEDGLAGICDRHQRICFALALWNGRDPILKERLFGLDGNEGNHGEDVKEQYFYLDNTPTHSYMKCLYKYPQAEFPYAQLLRRESPRARATIPNSNCSTRASSTRTATSTSSWSTPRPRREDILIRITAVQPRAGGGAAPSAAHHLVSQYLVAGGEWHRPCRPATPPAAADRAGRAVLRPAVALRCDGAPELLFTENETNRRACGNAANRTPYRQGRHRANSWCTATRAAVNPRARGTKARGTLPLHD